METERDNPDRQDTDKREPPRENSQSCPTCRQPMKRAMFRTGSVKHPGRDMHTCPNCGNRQ